MNDKSTASQLERQDFGNVTVLRVQSPTLREDATTGALFGQAYDAIDSGGRSQIVLNLDGVGFVASVALGKLMTLQRKARSAGGRMILCKVGRSVEELLHATRLADILLIYGDEHEAVRSFASTAGNLQSSEVQP
jgi:anti-sigma B factor antagonist